MLIALHGEGFESALIEVPVAARVMRNAPAYGVGVGEPAKEGGNLAVLLGPDDEMPVGGHKAEGEDADGVALVGQEEDAQEGVVVGGFAEHGHFADGAIEDMIDQSAGGFSGDAGHDER